jgi:hypothetical protein
VTRALSQPRFPATARSAGKARAAAVGRLPRGYGLLVGAGMSLSLWAGLGWLLARVF